MSIFSEYKVGLLTDEEFANECAKMNNKDRWEQEHEFDDEDDINEEALEELTGNIEEGVEDEQ